MIDIWIHENAAERHSDRSLRRKTYDVRKVDSVEVVRKGLLSVIAVIEKTQIYNRAWLSQEGRDDKGPTPAGIIHSSLLYDKDFSGETRGSRAVMAVVMRNDSFNTATFLNNIAGLLAWPKKGDSVVSSRKNM